MSARRRQETLERFSIPLEDDVTFGTPTEAPLSAARPRRSSTQVTLHVDSIDIDDNSDADFTVEGVSDNDEFLDDDDHDSAFSSKPREGKGKAKTKGKGKAKAGSTTRISARAGFNGASFAGENPKVMLISLKAGALGLNLTVANNVYL
jgi:SWI/SNF-related matrix-associated actin-dependent regulator of chromatin subfamily A3